MAVVHQPHVGRVLLEEKAWSKTICVYGKAWPLVRDGGLHTAGEPRVIGGSEQLEGGQEIQESEICLELNRCYGSYARAIAVRFPYASDRRSGD